jgi:hypothetical protein
VQEGDNLSILDCESHESALNSIADAYGASAGEIGRFLEDSDLDESYEGHRQSKPFDEYLVEVFESRFGPPQQLWSSVRWFHLTRVPPGSGFTEGILPLHLVLDKIWKSIISIPRDLRTRVNLESLKDSGVPDYLYNMRASDILHAGPFAMLVREAAFCPTTLWNNDYLKFPEIVEDICNGYEQKYGGRIHEEISAALRPCIVTFEVVENHTSNLIAPVLLYCRCKARDEDMWLDANACYDGKGEVILATAIRKIEFPQLNTND